MSVITNKSIILFDGVCNLCNSSVHFIIKHDPKAHFLFASLQSDAATKLLLHYNSKKNTFNSIILIEKGTIYKKSTAALKIAKNLNGFYPILYTFIIIPPFIRNYIYDFIATNRYKWFGKKESCMIPTKENKHRFL